MTVKDCKILKSLDEKLMKDTVATIGPIISGFTVTGHFAQFYKRGKVPLNDYFSINRITRFFSIHNIKNTRTNSMISNT